MSIGSSFIPVGNEQISYRKIVLPMRKNFFAGIYFLKVNISPDSWDTY